MSQTQPFARHATSRWTAPVAGVLAALLAAECGLRLFATGATLNGLPEGETYRQYSEGIATSHFNDDTSRATGNPLLPKAETILILGDSHVPAVQIADRATMGSVLERIARSHGVPLNVRQFGWSGEGYGIARTLALGPALAREHQAKAVVVVLSEGALRTYPADPIAARKLQDEAPPSIRNLDSAQRFVRKVAHYSVLVHLLYTRFRELQATSLAANGADRVQAACVRSPADDRRHVVEALRDAFGEKLVVLYAPEVGIDTPDAPDCWEQLMLPQCAQLAVRCISLRAGMIEERRQHRLMRGFHNTLIGTGHLNEAGHELAGRTLYEVLALAPAPAPAR